MGKHRDCKNNKTENTLKKHDKKRYIKPQLVKYGHLEELTQGVTGQGLDAQSKTYTR